MEKEPQSDETEPDRADEVIKRLCLQGIKYSVQSGKLTKAKGQELARELTGEVIKFDQD